MRSKAWLVFAYCAVFVLACGEATSGESDSSADVRTASSAAAVTPTAGGAEWKQEIWTRTFEVRYVKAYDVAVDSERNIYVVGTVAGQFPGQPVGYRGDYFVRKYDPLGNVLWTRQVDLGSSEAATSVVTDGTDIYIAVTSQWHSARFGLTAGAVVAKWDKSGNTIWTQGVDFAGGGVSLSAGLAVANSRVYLTGLAGETTYIGRVEPPTQASLVALNSADGAPVWAKNFGDPSADNAANGVVADADGIYVTGWTEGALAGQVSAGGNDGFVQKYDLSGALVWTRQFGTPRDDLFTGIALYSDALYLSGVSSSETPDTLNGFAQSYDPNGALRWSELLGAGSKTRASDIAANATGVYVAGSTRPAGEEDDAEDLSTIWKLDFDGMAQDNTYIRPAQPAYGAAIALDTERIYLASIFRMSHTSELTRLGGPDAKCRRIEGDLVVNNAQDARRIADMTGCFDVQGGVYVRGAAGIKNLRFLSGLRSVGESLGIARNPDLQNLRGLENLQSVGDYLTIEGNPALRRIDVFDSLVEVGGEVDIFNNQALEQIYFAVLARVPKLLIAGNDALLRVRAPNLARIARELHIENNDRLRRVEMARLDYVGQVRIRYNQAFSICRIEAFVAGIADVRGPVDIQGNDDSNPGGPCL